MLCRITESDSVRVCLSSITQPCSGSENAAVSNLENNSILFNRIDKTILFGFFFSQTHFFNSWQGEVLDKHFSQSISCKFVIL